MNIAQSTELAIVRTLTADVVFVPGGVEAILRKVEAEVRAIKTDISTDPGRSAIASLAYKVARSKTALDEMGKTLVADLKAKTNAIDAERRTIRERLDALRDEVRKPLTDWENAEKERVADHEAALVAVSDLATAFAGPQPSEVYRTRLRMIDSTMARDWQEFAARAAVAESEARAKLNGLLEAAEKQEAERAELERLRREQAERERREREERIAAEAAELARQEAETKARAEAEAAERRAREERERHEREKAQAEQAARDAEERARKAEAERVASEERAKAAAEEAAQQAARREQEAVEAERERVAAAKAAEEAETARREADKKHKAAINRGAAEAFVAGGLSQEAARTAVTLIAQRSIPNVSIQY